MRILLKRSLSSIAASLTILASLFCAGLPAMAGVYRCADAAGQVQFSDVPCPKDSTGREIEVRPNTVDTEQQREQVLRAENSALRAKLEEARNAQPTAAAAMPGADRADSAACKSARRDYEVSASSSSTTPAMLRARESMMYGACGMREPNRSTINIGNDANRLPSYVAPITPKAPTTPIAPR